MKMCGGENIWTLPNGLTLVRLFLVLPMVVSLIYAQWVTAFFIIAVASLTDFFDGFFARRWKQASRFGAALDPVADKLFVAASLIGVLIGIPESGIPWWFVGFIIVRETALLAGGFFLLQHLKGVTIRPTIFGKLTTFLILLLIIFVLGEKIFSVNQEIGFVPFLVGTALFCSTVAFLQYSKDFLNSFCKKK